MTLYIVHRLGRYYMTLKATSAEDAIEQAMAIGKPSERKIWSAREVPR